MRHNIALAKLLPQGAVAMDCGAGWGALDHRPARLDQMLHSMQLFSKAHGFCSKKGS